MNRETDLVRRIEDAVAHTASGVQDVHQSIADLPFQVLERNGVDAEVVSELRDIQSRTLGAIYDVVRSVNGRVASLATELLDADSADAENPA